MQNENCEIQIEATRIYKMAFSVLSVSLWLILKCMTPRVLWVAEFSGIRDGSQRERRFACRQKIAENYCTSCVVVGAKARGANAKKKSASCRLGAQKKLPEKHTSQGGKGRRHLSGSDWTQ
jgi:hypothetical protein